MIYNCVSGQSWSDVVCNTYGSMDFYGKFINENNLDPEVMPISNQAVNWDEKLVVDQSIINFINNGNIKYSTLAYTDSNTPPQPCQFCLITDDDIQIIDDNNNNIITN